MGAPGALPGRAPRCHLQRLDEARHLGFAQCLVAVEGPGLAIHEEEAEARANSAGPSSGSRDKRKRHDDNLAFSSWLSDKFGDDDGDEGDDSGACVRLAILCALLLHGSLEQCTHLTCRRACTALQIKGTTRSGASAGKESP